jgi:hypothetical protein
MASGLIENFLSTFTGLQEMERQKRKDADLMAQQAVDNELRRMAIKENSYWKEQADARGDELNLIRRERISEDHANRANLEANRLRDDERAATRATTLEREGRARMVNLGLGRGETQREARLNAGLTDAEIDTDLKGIADARMPGAVQQQQGSQAVNAVLQAMGYGEPVGVPGLPNADTVGMEQSKAFVAADGLRNSLLKSREMQNQKAAQDIEFKAEMNTKLLRAKDSQDALAQSQALINQARYEEILANKGLRREQFDWNKIMDQGRLNLGWANNELGKLQAALAQNRDIRADNNERKGLEAMFGQMKADRQDIFLKSRTALDEAEAVRKGAVDAISRLKYPAIMGTGVISPDAQMEIIELQKKLAEFSPEYIGKLKKGVQEAERARNEAHGVYVKARDLYSKVMTDKGTPAKPVARPGNRANGALPITGDLLLKDINAPRQQFLDRKTGKKDWFKLKDGKWIKE